MNITALKQFIVAVVVSGAAYVASATPAITYDLGTLNTTVGVADIQLSGTFDDTFKFIAGSQPNVIGSIVGIDLRGDLTVSYKFGVGLTPNWGASTLLASVPQDLVTGDFAFGGSANGLLEGETYWINLTGSVFQAAYSLTLVPLSVPEPGSLVLVTLALGLLGVARLRRKGSVRSL